MLPVLMFGLHIWLVAQWPLSYDACHQLPDSHRACPSLQPQPLQGTPLAAKMLYAAIFMGYCYQGPPFRCAAAASGAAGRPAGLQVPVEVFVGAHSGWHCCAVLL